MVTRATDPVCGMAVEREIAAAMILDHPAYYFCAPGCPDEFVANSEFFAKGSSVRHQ